LGENNTLNVSRGGSGANPLPTNRQGRDNGLDAQDKVITTEAGLNKIYLAAIAGMVLLAAAAFTDFWLRDSSRTVITFYTAADGRDLIEERIVKNAAGRNTEALVTGYVNEVLLGPLSYGAAGFFPGAAVQSCVVNGETAYIGLPSSVTLAGVKNTEDRLAVDTARSFGTLENDIKRNFRRLKHIVFFIDGREIKA
jgi:hypothetical protein